MTEYKIINQLESNQHIFKNLLNNKTPEEYLWRLQQGKWNLLEIVCHLYDEEREDFRSRIKHIFDNPLQVMTPINHEGWVLEREYATQNYEQKLEQFLSERQISINWLNSKGDANWNNFYKHPKLGNVSANLFLTNWLAHDYLHIKQITRYHYNYLKEETAINLQYAGNW